jgi:hypothetical protein
MAKVSWNDLHNATQNELKKTYKLNDTQLELQVRRHMDGASMEQRKGLYQTVYSKKR